MTQEDIALELNMTISSVSRLETGKYELKMADAHRWASVTGAQDVLIATLCTVDITIVQQILEVSSAIAMIWLGGLF